LHFLVQNTESPTHDRSVAALGIPSVWPLAIRRGCFLDALASRAQRAPHLVPPSTPHVDLLPSTQHLGGPSCRPLRTRRQRSGTGFGVTMPVWPRTSSVLIAQFNTSCPVRHPDQRPVRHPDQHVAYMILPMQPSQRPCQRKPALLPLTSASLSPSLGEGQGRGSTPPPACPGGYPQGGADRSDSSAADARGRKQRQIAATSALRMLPTARAPAWLRQPVAPGRTSTAQYASCCGRQWSARPFFRALHSRGTANAPAWGDPGLLRRPRR
jgi:hypothetical protein